MTIYSSIKQYILIAVQALAEWHRENIDYPLLKHYPWLWWHVVNGPIYTSIVANLLLMICLLFYRDLGGFISLILPVSLLGLVLDDNAVRDKRSDYNYEYNFGLILLNNTGRDLAICWLISLVRGAPVIIIACLWYQGVFNRSPLQVAVFLCLCALPFSCARLLSLSFKANIARKSIKSSHAIITYCLLDIAALSVQVGLLIVAPVGLTLLALALFKVEVNYTGLASYFDFASVTLKDCFRCVAVIGLLTGIKNLSLISVRNAEDWGGRIIIPYLLSFPCIFMFTFFFNHQLDLPLPSLKNASKDEIFSLIETLTNPVRLLIPALVITLLTKRVREKMLKFSAKAL